MSENTSRSENESRPSDEYLFEEIAKIKAELEQLKNFKDKAFRPTKSVVKRKPAKKRAAVKKKAVVKRKPAKKRAAVKKKAVVKRKPAKKRAVVKKKAIRRK
jgi:hypothetical protein